VRSYLDRHHRPEDDGPHRSTERMGSGDLHGLSTPLPAPDLTDQIMGRLGYQRVSERAARRQRARRRLARTGALFCAALAIAGGMHYYTLGQRARRAGMPTIQNAVSASLEEGTRAVSGFSRALRDMLTPDVAPATLQHAPSAAPLQPPGPFFEWMPDNEPLHVSRVRWSGLL